MIFYSHIPSFTTLAIIETSYLYLATHIIEIIALTDQDLERLRNRNKGQHFSKCDPRPAALASPGNNRQARFWVPSLNEN
jgi:hypothetical protein